MKTSLRSMVALAAAGMLTLAACGGEAEDAGTPTTGTDPTGDGGGSYSIGITQIVSHPSLDAARDGFKEGLAEAGIEATFDEQNAQNDQATATSIATRFAGADLDLVLAIATPSAQAVAASITDVPVLFTAVTDPVSADLVDSLDTPGANLTGTTDMNPVAEQIALVKRVAPDAQSVGIIYSSGEVNSEIQVELAREAAEQEGLEVVETTVTTTAEVLQAAQTLDVDAIYVPTDNTVVSGLDSVLQTAEERRIPVIAGETESVTNGALVTYGLDYYELGVQTAQMAAAILTEGADPAAMAVEEQQTPRLVVNPAAAERMGITLPQDLLDEADEVVE